MSTLSLDKIDMKILAALQRNGRITNQDLSRSVSLSPSSCLQRVRRLEQAEVLQSYHARLDLAKVARHLTCIAMVSLKNHTAEDFRAFESLVESIPEVVECLTVSGESDFFLRIICADMNRYLEINEQLVGSSNCQVNINTYVVMKENKAFQGVQLDTLKGAEAPAPE